MARPTLFLALIIAVAGMTQAQERESAFPQESVTFFSTSEGLPSNTVTALAIASDGQVIAATDAGVAAFDKEEETWESLPTPDFSVRYLAAAADAVYAGEEKHLSRLQDGEWKSIPTPAAAITGILASRESEAFLVSTVEGVYVIIDGTQATSLDSPKELILSMAHSRSGELVLGTPRNLHLHPRGESWKTAVPGDARYRWAPRDIAAVAFDASGNLAFGAREGVGIRDHITGEWTLYTGSEGLPFNEFTCVAAGKDGAIWFGTTRGAIRFEDGRFAWRSNRRWLLDDHVNDIVVQEDGAAWIATPAGISRISRPNMTLDEKSVYFTQQTETRHNREGFIADCALAEQFNVASWQPKISDNDGMYTAMYGAAKAFEYAATKNPEAKELAKRSFQACKWLVDITGSGMPARVIIPSDWHEPVNEQYGPEYNERKKKGDPFWKLITPRFVASEDGEHLWKCDTSSDELAGHYFFYPVYYDLVAETEEEKEEARQVIRAVTDHLIDNGFVLRDHDGLPTRWGRFDPEFFNSVDGWEQRGLNSMMMLSFLKAAEHMTGDPRYTETAQMLREKEHYHINAMQPKMYFPTDWVVPWDNNLCLMTMYTLMNYEEDPELLLIWRLGLEHAWLHISKQKNAFWNLLHQAGAARFDRMVDENAFDAAYPHREGYAVHLARSFYGGGTRIEDTIETLRGIPLDLIGYHMDNTHRLDIVFDPAPGQNIGVGVRGAKGWHFDGRALPIEERGHVRQDRDGFDLNASEDDGNAEHEGTFFLLPYWMGVHHGFIK